MSFDPSHVCYGCFKEKEPGTVCPKCGFNESSERAYLAVPLGTILDGRYLIGKVLGVGGFGITYLGYDLTLDYKVAVKEYMPSGFATRADDKYTLTVTSSSQQQAYDEVSRIVFLEKVLNRNDVGRAVELCKSPGFA